MLPIRDFPRAIRALLTTHRQQHTAPSPATKGSPGPSLRPEPGTEFPYAISDLGQAAAEALGTEWETESGYLGAWCLLDRPRAPLLHLRIDYTGDLLIGPAGGEDEDGHYIELSGVPKTAEQLATAGEQIAAVIRQHWA
ncbi:hypothetical protein ACWGSE_24045 [Streptomyces diastaticus]|uniref:hypothetical protein n=1 Tax=Streptomyces TaxID=1883 RepID=UPI000C258CE4|nr:MULTISPECIES: hypothetical protein [unclassified Streptomyces]MBL3806124.1 hypothetical protein [Streptomyces sp. BRB081]PJM80675.1 hypothetical protein CH313_27220 [Streptomyces sp. TSRI0384-2]RPK79876.1 hypothetical protein EES47_29080 [Streptomyces sp. ADI98-12]